MNGALGAIAWPLVLTVSSLAAPEPSWTLEFDGCLPPEATLTRDSPRLDALGREVAAHEPRFTNAAVTPGARLLVRLPLSDRVMAVGRVGGQEIAIIQRNHLALGITAPTFGYDSEEIAWAHETPQARFGWPGSEWGCPKAAEIFPSGVILIHTCGAGPELRSATVRTSFAGFTQPDGFALTRLSSYAPPPGGKPTIVCNGFTRTTHLPNLGVWVSGIAEYETPGPVSAHDPTDGRSLGWASTDEGLTWTRVIDTDDPSLGRGLVERAKHLHHVEPFEWYDTENGRWNIGAVGCLGDGPGRTGLVWVRSPQPTFPPEGQNDLMTAIRTKAIGRRAFTDLFPLDPSDSPDSPMRFILGADTELTGIFEATVHDDLQIDRARWRPTVPYMTRDDSGRNMMLPGHPYLFQIDRLGSGAIVAACNDGHPVLNPNGLWVGDPTGQHWATALLIDDFGYRCVKPVAENRFWARLWTQIDGDNVDFWELWELEPPTVRPALQLGPGAGAARDLELFVPSEDLEITDATGIVPPPERLPEDTPVYRMFTDTTPPSASFAIAELEAPGASPGDLVSIHYWIKVGRADACVQRIEQDIRTYRQASGYTYGDSLAIWLENNEWIPITLYTVWPEEPFDSMRTVVNVIGDVTPERPLDYLFTQPRVVVTTQPIDQEPNPAGPTEPDRLSLAIPALGDAWTIAVLATEAPTFALTLADDTGESLTLVTTAPPDSPAYLLTDTTLTLSRTDASGTTAHAASSPQDTLMPTQDLVVFRREAGAPDIEVLVARGMGELETLAAPGLATAPSSARLASADDAVHFEGLLHRVTVWPEDALPDERIGALRTTFDPNGPSGRPGDIVPDGAIDVADFLQLAAHFGIPEGACPRDGDADHDGDIDVYDFAIVAAWFGCGP
jgi:hypothetical protein